MQGLDIIIFAGIAVFFILRLIGVIGQREEEEEPPRKKNNIINLQHRYQQAKKQARRGETIDSSDSDDSGVVIDISAKAKAENSHQPFQKILQNMEIKPSSKLGKQLKKLHSRSKSFHPQEFLTGAESAFEMILDAYAKGEMSLLKNLTTKEIYKLFDQSVSRRKKDGQRLQLVILAIKQMSIVSADVDSGNLSVAVKFVSEQNSVLYDKNNKIISGDPKNKDIVTDIWTFIKPVNVGGPNWYLAATGSDA